jgi:DNA polymerase-4
MFVDGGGAAILHADLDAFFASVEQRDDPTLRDRPVIVGGGVVLAASYPARARGVRTAMGGRQALRLCPDAVVVPPRFDAYVAASRAVFDVFARTSPLVEGVSIDEAFLDVAGLRRVSGTPRQIGDKLRATVRAEVGLAVSVGIGRTKFLAKMASRSAKPDGLLEVPPDRERQFLYPMAVERLWGVGPATAERLHAIGIVTVADLAAMPATTLVSLLGKGSGYHLHALAHGRDARPVRTGVRRRSIGSQRALGRGPHAPREIEAALMQLVERVTRRMRGAGREGRTVTLRLRFDDFTRCTRSRTLADRTASTALVQMTAERILDGTWPLIHAKGLTLLGVSVSGFGADDAVQLELPFPGRERGGLDRAVDAALDGTLDVLRDRYGSTAVTKAALLGRDPGLAMPHLPD